MTKDAFCSLCILYRCAWLNFIVGKVCLYVKRCSYWLSHHLQIRCYHSSVKCLNTTKRWQLFNQHSVCLKLYALICQFAKKAVRVSSAHIDSDPYMIQNFQAGKVLSSSVFHTVCVISAIAFMITRCTVKLKLWHSLNKLVQVCTIPRQIIFFFLSIYQLYI